MITYICMYVYKCIYYLFIYIYVNICIHIYIYIFTCICISSKRGGHLLEPLLLVRLLSRDAQRGKGRDERCINI